MENKINKLEEGGVFGVFGDNDAVYTLYCGLYGLQHRGQASCGAVCSDHFDLSVVKGKGLVHEVIEPQLAKLRGDMGIGHVRYGDNTDATLYAQPLISNYLKGNICISIAGKITNSEQLRAMLEDIGAIFQVGSDAEIMAHLFARERTKTDSIESAVLRVMNLLQGAYAVLIMSSSKLLAFRDKDGLRPLAIGKKGDCLLFSSEDIAFPAAGGEKLRDVMPGELILASTAQKLRGALSKNILEDFVTTKGELAKGYDSFDNQSINLPNDSNNQPCNSFDNSYNQSYSLIANDNQLNGSADYPHKKDKDGEKSRTSSGQKIYEGGNIEVTSFAEHCHLPAKTCIYEYLYFARPDSVLDGVSVYSVRVNAGKRLFATCPAAADLVIGVPSAGLHYAMGYAEASGIPFGDGLIRNYYLGRTSSYDDIFKEKSVNIKLNVIKAAVCGKRVVLVDDSMIRGITAKKIVSMLREAGAKEVHLRIACPRFGDVCPYSAGIKSGLRGKTVDSICKNVGADSLMFLPNEELDNIGVGKDNCKSCF